MIGFALVLILAVVSTAHAQGVQQTTYGWCSPAIHEVVGDVVITCNGVDPKALERLNELLDKKDLEPEAKVKQAESWTRTYQELKDRLASLSETSELAQEAEAALEQGEFNRVAANLDRLISQQEAQPVRQHKQLAQSYASRAALSALQFDYRTAWDYYQAALRYQPNDAAILNAAGDLVSNWGRYGEAEPLFRRALEIREKASHPNDREIGESLSNLAALYLVQGRYDGAEPLCRRALEIREMALGSNSREVSDSLSQLATLHFAKARYGEAEPLFRRALEIREKVLGPNHPEIGETLSDLAALHRAQGHYGEAEWLLRRALPIREKAFGVNHPSVAFTLNNLAILYLEQDRYSDARPLLDRALTIQEKVLGRDHPSVALTLNNLAALHQKQGRYDQARPLVERAIAIQEEAVGPEHPSIATSLNNLATTYLDLNNLAMTYLDQALFDQAHVGEAELLLDRALTIQEQAHVGEAELLLDRALTIQEKVLGYDHPDVAISLTNLAMVYLRQRHAAEAEPVLQRALAIQVKAFGPDHPNVTRTCNLMAELHSIRMMEGMMEDMLKSANDMFSGKVESQPTYDEQMHNLLSPARYLNCS